jgi:hypothetical protein
MYVCTVCMYVCTYVCTVCMYVYAYVTSAVRLSTITSLALPRGLLLLLLACHTLCYNRDCVTGINIFVCMYVCMCVCTVCIYLCMYVCTYVIMYCMYVCIQ